MTAFGQAVKEAREQKGLTREEAAEILDISTRYFMYVETRGQHTSLQKLYEIATFFDISVDQFFFTDKSDSKTTQRLQLDTMLNGMGENDLSIVYATTNAILKAKETEKR
jgi:transcriptional regulator with XRE-family HTH domain